MNTTIAENTSADRISQAIFEHATRISQEQEIEELVRALTRTSLETLRALIDAACG